MSLRILSAFLLFANIAVAADLKSEPRRTKGGVLQYPVTHLLNKNAVTFEFFANGQLVAQQRISADHGNIKVDSLPVAGPSELRMRLSNFDAETVSVRVISGGRIVDQFRMPPIQSVAPPSETASAAAAEVGSVSANTTEFTCPEHDGTFCEDELWTCEMSCYDLEQCRECRTNYDNCVYGEPLGTWTEETIVYESQLERICGVVNHTLYDEFALYDVFLKKRWTTTYERRYCPYTGEHTYIVSQSYDQEECYDMVDGSVGACPSNMGIHNLTNECRIFN